VVLNVPAKGGQAGTAGGAGGSKEKEKKKNPAMALALCLYKATLNSNSSESFFFRPLTLQCLNKSDIKVLHQRKAFPQWMASQAVIVNSPLPCRVLTRRCTRR